MQNTLADGTNPLQQVTREIFWTTGFGGVRRCAPGKQYHYLTRLHFKKYHEERSRRIRLTRALCMMHVPLSSWHAYCKRMRFAGTVDNNGGDMEDGVILVETLALGSVETSTQNNFLAKWKTRINERKEQRKGR